MQVTSIERHVQFDMTLKPSVPLPSSFLLLPLPSYPFLILPDIPIPSYPSTHDQRPPVHPYAICLFRL